MNVPRSGRDRLNVYSRLYFKLMGHVSDVAEEKWTQMSVLEKGKVCVLPAAQLFIGHLLLVIERKIPVTSCLYYFQN